MPVPALSALGLKEKEAAVYEALLKSGEVPIAELIVVLKEHPQIVYRHIEHLAARGMVIVTTRKHRKYVRAEDPRALERKEVRRLEYLQQSLPDLLALQKTGKDAIVRVSRGSEAVRALRLKGIERLPEGGIYYVIGGSGDRFYEVMGERNESVEKKRIQKKIKKRLVTFDSQRKTMLRQEQWKTYADYRFLPQSFPIPSSTNIAGDLVAILIWTEDPIVIEIESPHVAESYRNYFSVLWKAGRK